MLACTTHTSLHMSDVTACMVSVHACHMCCLRACHPRIFSMLFAMPCTYATAAPCFLQHALLACFHSEVSRMGLVLSVSAVCCVLRCVEVVSPSIAHM